jgi:hypothetical protein
MVPRSRGVLPATGKTCPRRYNGVMNQQKPAVLSFSAMTPTLQPGLGIIGRLTTFPVIALHSPRVPVGPATRKGLKQTINDFGRLGYGGPCPPRGHGPHHYHFRLLALSIDRLAVHKDSSCRDIEREARKHLIAEAILVGLYQR